MLNKISRLFVDDMSFRLRLAAMVVLILSALGLWRWHRVQQAEIKNLEEQGRLVSLIPELQRKLQKLKDDEGFVLNGIVFKVNPMAAINGQVVKTGDVVGEKKVMEITAHSVVLADAVNPDKVITLSLDE